MAAEYFNKQDGYTPSTKDVCDNYTFAERYYEGGDTDELKKEFFRWLDGIIAKAKDEP